MDEEFCILCNSLLQSELLEKTGLTNIAVVTMGNDDVVLKFVAKPLKWKNSWQIKHFKYKIYNSS